MAQNCRNRCLRPERGTERVPVFAGSYTSPVCALLRMPQPLITKSDEDPILRRFSPKVTLYIHRRLLGWNAVGPGHRLVSGIGDVALRLRVFAAGAVLASGPSSSPPRPGLLAHWSGGARTAPAVRGHSEAVCGTCHPLVAAGIAPSCCSMLNMSNEPRNSTILPSRMR